uniref:cytochrome P450 1A1-like n=1 Tax=Ciona intestinalis TaxID=7719 RepID=UPI000EF4B562|nr:cytochrome P450 1A1-like [Ciona intestinalis]|eukprot:XP_018672119.2 cytochrome P450 1A1-like [Ciona intestinalis]
MRNHSPRDSWFHEENLVNCLVDIYTAGTDAPTNVILWAMVTLLHKPNLQHLLFHEINNKTNSNEDLSNRWPLLKAFIQENFRFNPPAPLSIPHQTNQGVKLDKYFIPKDTMIISNIYAVNHDPKIWKNPYEFNIYRHIDTDGKFVPSTKVIAFGIGCRSCLGEKLGRLEIFYFLANMIKRFEILPDPGSKDLPPINEGGNSILHLPIHFKVVFKPRENEDYFSL